MISKAWIYAITCLNLSFSFAQVTLFSFTILWDTTKQENFGSIAVCVFHSCFNGPAILLYLKVMISRNPLSHTNLVQYRIMFPLAHVVPIVFMMVAHLTCWETMSNIPKILVIVELSLYAIFLPYALCCWTKLGTYDSEYFSEKRANVEIDMGK